YHSGEIRGQLLPMSERVFLNNLFGSNEIPSVQTNGSGSIIAELKQDTLILSGSFSNLSGQFDANYGGGSVVYIGSAGQNGSSSFILKPTLNSDRKSGIFSASNNRFVLSAAQKQALMASRLYANIHTVFSATGEIRGQFAEASHNVFRAFLSGANEYPYVQSTGNGQVIAELSGNKLMVSGAFRDLTSPININIAGGAHIHAGLPGTNGPVTLLLKMTPGQNGLSATFSRNENTFTFTDDQIAMLMERGFYVNIHTAAHHPGEIRGQLMNESQYVMYSYLTGSQEVPQVLTNAHGSVIAEVSGNHVVLAGSFSDLEGDFDKDIAGGAHLHMGIPGRNGGIASHIHVMTAENLRSGQIMASHNHLMLITAQIEALSQRGIYVNIHTKKSASGEIRGNLLGEANGYFVSMLGGASQLRPVNTPGMGLVITELAGPKITSVGSVSLSSPFNPSIARGALIQVGAAGSQGSVAYSAQLSVESGGMSGTFRASENTINLAQSQLKALNDRMMFLNIHTNAHPTGEVRGQILPLANYYLHTTLSGMHEVPAVTTQGLGSVKAEVTGTKAVFSGSFINLTGAFDANIAGGAHIHMAPNGQNGPIAIHLHTDVDQDKKSGMFVAKENTKTITASQEQALRNAMMYVNIHTSTFPSGEVRGQLLAEINRFPTPSMLVSPADGTVSTLSDLPDTLNIEWSSSQDPDGNIVSYIWQLATDANFSNTIASVDTRLMNMTMVPKGILQNLLGADPFGNTNAINLYHRVVSKDGSQITNGPAATLQLTQEMSLSPLNSRSVGFEFAVKPNPIVNQFNLDFESESNGTGKIKIINLQGQKVYEQATYLQAGWNSILIDSSNFNPGTFILTIETNNSISEPRKIIKI
ncbi:MAG TPA: CHRD domain-containing protein, partial [Saprospiraceae bacterium]|nr:CHRD domain-containing protein [Saprospiraceae bacterium]